MEDGKRVSYFPGRFFVSVYFRGRQGLRSEDGICSCGFGLDGLCVCMGYRWLFCQELR
jgi:hypothetical protein